MRKSGYNLPKIIAIDFDGCLFENAYPRIGRPYKDVINAAIEEQRKGAKLILWTCRVDGFLEAAIQACKEQGLTFNAVNENIPEAILLYHNNTRKVFAHEYWDDRSVRFAKGERKTGE